MDNTIRNFENTLINYINSVELPIEVKRIVVKDIFTQLEIASDKAIQKQRETLRKSEESEDDKNV